jgi:hypothetical protein
MVVMVSQIEMILFFFSLWNLNGLYLVVIVSFPYLQSKYLIGLVKERNYLFCLIVLEISVNHGIEGLVKQNNSHHGSQEAHTDNCCASRLLLSSPFILSGA